MKAICKNVTKVNQQAVNSDYVEEEIPVDEIDKIVPAGGVVTVYHGTRNWLKCESVEFETWN